MSEKINKIRYSIFIITTICLFFSYNINASRENNKHDDHDEDHSDTKHLKSMKVKIMGKSKVEHDHHDESEHAHKNEFTGKKDKHDDLDGDHSNANHLKNMKVRIMGKSNVEHDDHDESEHAHKNESTGKKDKHEDHGEDSHDDHDETIDKINIPEEVLKTSKITLDHVMPRKIKSIRKFNGRISANQDKVSVIVPRYPGVIKKIFKSLGEKIKKGNILTEVEANSGLAKYFVRSKIDGVVVKKLITTGEYVGTQTKMFEIIDLRTVWVNINLTEIDHKKIKLGQKVVLRLWDSKENTEGKLEYISPIINYDSQTFLARATINNENKRWRPGSFVHAQLVLIDDYVNLSIHEEAIQLVEEKTVIFVKEDDGFEVRKVKLGRSGGGFVEILSGVSKGEQYVVSNSFVLKSELLKASAGHDHAH